MVLNVFCVTQNIYAQFFFLLGVCIYIKFFYKQYLSWFNKILQHNILFESKLNKIMLVAYYFVLHTPHSEHTSPFMFNAHDSYVIIIMTLEKKSWCNQKLFWDLSPEWNTVELWVMGKNDLWWQIEPLRNGIQVSEETDNKKITDILFQCILEIKYLLL